MQTSDFGVMLSELQKDATDACWAIGYMKAVVDEPVVGEKIGDSFSGYAMEVSMISVKRSLALYCARAWDHGADVISIPRLRDLLPSSEHLRIERESWYRDPAFFNEVEKLELQHAKLLNDLAQVDQSRVSSLRVFRTEKLAHRLTTSNDRKKIERSGPVVDTTIRELVEFAELTVGLLGRLGLVLEGENSPYAELIERSQRYCREFWRVLPKLGEVESPEVR
jgi:AbiU2